MFLRYFQLFHKNRIAKRERAINFRKRPVVLAFSLRESEKRAYVLPVPPALMNSAAITHDMMTSQIYSPTSVTSRVGRVKIKPTLQ